MKTRYEGCPNQMNIKYPIRIAKENEKYVATFPDFPGMSVVAPDEDELLKKATELLTNELSNRIKKKSQIPPPSGAVDGMQTVAPAARVQSALLVRLARGDRHIAKVARQMKTSWAAFSQLEDPEHSVKLKQLERAAATLGKRLVLSFEDDDKNKAA